VKRNEEASEKIEDPKFLESAEEAREMGSETSGRSAQAV